MKEEWFKYWFLSIDGINGKKKKILKEEYGSYKEIFRYKEKIQSKRANLTEKEKSRFRTGEFESDIEAMYINYKKKGVSCVTVEEYTYPERLKNIYTPPYGLFYIGELPSDEKPSAAIVGARQCTTYGEQMAILFGEKLAEAGVQIISGMARGIDGAGQRGALNKGGKSYGVLGGGIDICYPKEHYGLYMDLQDKGGVLSEHGLGVPPMKSFFPARNRIISGLSDVVLIIEAKEKSGSLITADMALEQGKEVYALPGPIDSIYSYGCNKLIKEGAGIIVSIEEMMEEIICWKNRLCYKMNVNSDKNKKILESDEKLVYSKLGLIPKSINCLCDEVQLHPVNIMKIITNLVLKGYVLEVSRNYYIKNLTSE